MTTIDDDADTGAAADRPVGAATATGGAPRRTSGWLVAGVGLVVVSLVLAVLGAVDWRQADHSSSRALAIARDNVVVQAHIDIATINTLDYRHVQSGLKGWLSVTTGSLHKQISRASTSETQVIARAKVTTNATVLAAAVTALDLKAGTATVIASVQVIKTPATGAAVTSRNRFRASLTRVGDQWLLANLAPVQVQLS